MGQDWCWIGINDCEMSSVMRCYYSMVGQHRWVMYCMMGSDCCMMSFMMKCMMRHYCMMRNYCMGGGMAGLDDIRRGPDLSCRLSHTAMAASSSAALASSALSRMEKMTTQAPMIFSKLGESWKNASWKRKDTMIPEALLVTATM